MPECGSNSLLWPYTSGCLEIKHVYENSCITWGLYEPDEIREYHCGECGHELEFGEIRGSWNG